MSKLSPESIVKMNGRELNLSQVVSKYLPGVSIADYVTQVETLMKTTATTEPSEVASIAVNYLRPDPRPDLDGGLSVRSAHWYESEMKEFNADLTRGRITTSDRQFAETMASLRESGRISSDRYLNWKTGFLSDRYASQEEAASGA